MDPDFPCDYAVSREVTDATGEKMYIQNKMNKNRNKLKANATDRFIKLNKLYQ